MSELDDAMQEHMAFIVSSEIRPFSFHDFLRFKVNEYEYSMTHGTFRNKISRLIKSGTVELSYYSHCAFYTLKGHKFGKSMTPNHAVVHNNPIYQMLQNLLPLEKQSIHNIRLEFHVPNSWEILSNNSKFPKNKRSQDIVIPSWKKDNAIVRIIVHKTNSISVIIGCSLEPILLEPNEIVRLHAILVRAEERLKIEMENSNLFTSEPKPVHLPEYTSWTVTMWHFGRDGSTEFSGERFHINFKDAQNVFTRIYIKDFKNKSKSRIELQSVLINHLVN